MKSWIRRHASRLGLAFGLGALPASAALPTGSVTNTSLSPLPNLTICPLETLTVCKNPGYYKTTCGKNSLSANRDNPAWICAPWVPGVISAAKTAKGAVQKSVLVPKMVTTPTGNVTTSGIAQTAAWTVADTPNRHVQTGNKSVLAGRLMSLTPAQRAAWNQAQTTPPAGYVGATASSPADVNSCAELAFEKFWDFSRLEEAAAASGHDARTVANLAFSGASGWSNATAPGTTLDCTTAPCTTRPGYYGTGMSGFKLAGTTLRERSGAAMPQFTPVGTGCRTKNAFLEDVPGRFVFGNSTCHYTESLSWHAQMNQALAGISDEKLEYLQARGRRYRYLANRRAELLMGMTTAQAAKCAGLSPMSPGCQAQPVMLEAVQAVDAEIDVLRAEAQEAGCLNAGTAATACDWAPSLFRDRLYAQYRPARDAVFTRCEAAMNKLKTFEPNALIPAWAPAKSLWFKRNPAEFDKLYTELDKLNSLKAAGVPGDAAGAPIVSEQWTGSDSLGGDFFGVSYSYDSGYRYRANKDASGQVQVCTAEAEVWGDLVVDAKAFSANIDVVDAHVRATPSSFTGDIRVLGKTLLAANNPSFTKTINLVNESHQDDDEWKISVPLFEFLFISVEVGIGVGYQVGVDTVVTLTASGKAGGICNSNVKAVVDGQVRPWGRVDGFATVALDAIVVEVGIKGALNLIDASLDFKGRLATELSTVSTGPLAGKLLLSVAPRLDYRLGTLAGRISLYGCLDLFFFEECVETDLARWDGVVTSGTPFDRNWKADATLFSVVLAP